MKTVISRYELTESNHATIVCKCSDLCMYNINNDNNYSFAETIEVSICLYVRVAHSVLPASKRAHRLNIHRLLAS